MYCNLCSVGRLCGLGLRSFEHGTTASASPHNTDWGYVFRNSPVTFANNGEFISGVDQWPSASHLGVPSGFATSLFGQHLAAAERSAITDWILRILPGESGDRLGTRSALLAMYGNLIASSLVISFSLWMCPLAAQLSLSDTRVMVLEQQLLHRQSDSQQLGPQPCKEPCRIFSAEHSHHTCWSLESLRREFGALQAVVSGLSRDSDALPREPLSAASTECGQGQPPSRGSRSSADSSRGIHLNLLLSSEDSTI
eukprot:m.135304 g.135304  ORF g.135304 m.135304 type:complete len:254 (-) comp52452_c0_seq12:52-813(-)